MRSARTRPSLWSAVYSQAVLDDVLHGRYDGRGPVYLEDLALAWSMAPARLPTRVRRAWSAGPASLQKTPGIVELLRRLAGRSLAVVTNKPTDQAVRVVDDLGLSPLIPFVVGPELAERCKPAPEPLFAALERLGRQPSEAVMVGDGTTDMLAGRDAGTATVAVLWGYWTREQLAACRPDHMAETVASLAQLLTGRPGRLT